MAQAVWGIATSTSQDMWSYREFRNTTGEGEESGGEQQEKGGKMRVGKEKWA